MQILQHPSAFGNVPESLPGILEKPFLDSCGVRGHRCTKVEGDQKTREDMMGGRKESTTAGERKEECDLLKRKIRITNMWKGKDNTASVIPLAADWEYDVKQWEEGTRKRKCLPAFSWLILLQITTKEERRMRWHRAVFWFALIILCLSLKPASSQVRVAFKSHFHLYSVGEWLLTDCCKN